MFIGVLKQGRARKSNVKTLRSHYDTLPYSTFRRILEAMRVEWRNSPQERGNQNIKYLISSSGNQIHNLLHLLSNYIILFIYSCVVKYIWSIYDKKVLV